MKLASGIKKLIKNHTFGKVVMGLFGLNVFGYIMMNNYDAVILTGIVGIIAKNFVKNITGVLLITTVLVSILMVVRRSYNISEGMENSSDADDADADADADDVDTDDTDDADDADADATMTKNAKQFAKMVNLKKQLPDGDSEKSSASKKGSGKPSIDYASTVEEAYDNLNGILGSKGMSNLTKDTKNLASQQQNLIETMQGMAPLMENMAPLMESAEKMMKNLNGMKGFENIEGLMQKIAK